MKATDNGDILENNEIGMLCEYPNCTRHKGKDYERLKSEQEIGWEDEPIYLCDEHSKGHKALN